MEQTRLVNLPVIGMVQRGKVEQTQKGTKKVIELSHFVAKVNDEHMVQFLQKFNDLYEGKSSIDIEIFDEEPFTTKYIRYNQSGTVCSCPTTSNKAHQKTKNGWKEVDCSSDCEHRQRNEQGKCNCNRIGWFKFLMPSICTDRIWLMKITGQTSIDRLQDYFTLQQIQGKSLKGQYTLFLKLEDIDDYTGKSYKHYILDIVQKANINSNQIPQTTQNQNKLSTTNAQTVNNNAQKQPISATKKQEKSATESKVQEKATVTEKSEKIKPKETTKKAKSTTKVKQEATSQVENNTKKESKENSLENCYVLVKTYTKNIKQKTGEEKPYLMGEFYDMEDNPYNVAINPKDAYELQQCDMGTVTKLTLKTIGDIHFAINIEYVQKCKKNVAA